MVLCDVSVFCCSCIIYRIILLEVESVIEIIGLFQKVVAEVIVFVISYV